MKAIVQEAYGSTDDVLELREIDKPVVKDDDVMLRVHAVALHAGDALMLRGVPYLMRPAIGLLKPKNRVPGTDVAGHVEAVGKNVKQFQPGDEVFGTCSGACAEFACAREDKFVIKPANLTFDQASAITTSAATALHGLRDAGKIETGQKVLIIGASGGVGTFAVQIAKSYDTEVTGMCSTRNVDMVRSIGADHVIDYTQEDFTKSDERYDLIIDIAGNRSLSQLRNTLEPKGTLVLLGGKGGPWLNGLGRSILGHVSSPFFSQSTRFFISFPNNEDLVVLKEFVESGKVTPVIDRTYPLSETPEALAYVEEGHTQGKTVITV